MTIHQLPGGIKVQQLDPLPPMYCAKCGSRFDKSDEKRIRYSQTVYKVTPKICGMCSWNRK